MVSLIGVLVAGVIGVGILLIVVDADQGNEVVDSLIDPARWLSGPFHGLFDLESAHAQTAVNWGTAAVAYFALSRVIAGVLNR